MGVPPNPNWTETATGLKKTGTVTLDANGQGVVTFDTDSSRQRWVVEEVIVSTNQPATSTVVPVATVALNTTSFSTLSANNQRGSFSWSGNNDIFRGSTDVGPMDFLSVIFAPAPGATPGQIATLSGVLGTAIILGIKYTRRA